MVIAATRLRVMISMMIKIRLAADISAIKRSYLDPVAHVLVDRGGATEPDLGTLHRRPFDRFLGRVLDRSTYEIPSGEAGSPSWEMMKRAACPSGDRNIFRPRLKSGLSKTSGGM